MLDILTVQEIEIDSRLRASELEADFQRLYLAPVLRAQLIQDVLSTPGLAEQLKASDPVEYERVMAQIQRMQGIAKAGHHGTR